MSSLDFNHLDSFNQGGLKTRLTKKQKIVIAVAAVLVIALAVLLCVKAAEEVPVRVTTRFRLCVCIWSAESTTVRWTSLKNS